MKTKIFVSIPAILTFVSANALAQGTVNWSGPNFGDFTGQTNSTQYSPLTGGGSTGGGTVGNTQGTIASGTGYYGELLYTSFTGSQAPDPATLASLAGWTDAGLSVTNGTVNSRFSVVGLNVGQVVPWATGVTQSVMLVTWSQNLGSTYAAALAAMESGTYSSPAYFGESATGYIAPFSSDPGANLFGSIPNVSGLPIYSLDTQLYLLNPGFSASIAPVPEPAPFALAAMGALWLATLGRRK